MINIMDDLKVRYEKYFRKPKKLKFSLIDSNLRNADFKLFTTLRKHCNNRTLSPKS